MTRLYLIASAILLAPSALAQAPQDHSAHGGAPPATQQDHAGHTPPPADAHAGHEGHKPAADPHAGHDMHVADAMRHDMTGVFGPYPMGRDASGTSWAPDAANHGGVLVDTGDWTLMGHATLQGVYSFQDGPRGDEKAYAAGMLMGAARRDFTNGDALNFRAMVSPDPLMGKDGYPLLLAAGETADGVEPLIDRQHPHDMIMELSASYAKKLSSTDSVFLYGGLPGEPAFGPPAFMHRPAAMESPEAPITHHWLDSTHITFGVLTAGWIHGDWKIEGSRFRGREPDQDRYDIETGELDSSAVRVSWNPGDAWALQASWADVISPEGLEPDDDETRWSASALYTQAHEGIGEVSFTGAFARKDRSDGVILDAWLAEASIKPNDAWTVFSRAELIETNELGVDHHGPVERVGKVSVGVVHDWKIGPDTRIGVGALVSRNGVSETLSPLYGGDNPWGGMAFVRLKIG